MCIEKYTTRDVSSKYHPHFKSTKIEYNNVLNVKQRKNNNMLTRFHNHCSYVIQEYMNQVCSTLTADQTKLVHTENGATIMRGATDLEMVPYCKVDLDGNVYAVIAGRALPTPSTNINDANSISFVTPFGIRVPTTA